MSIPDLKTVVGLAKHWAVQAGHQIQRGCGVAWKVACTCSRPQSRSSSGTDTEGSRCSGDSGCCDGGIGRRPERCAEVSWADQMWTAQIPDLLKILTC